MSSFGTTPFGADYAAGKLGIILFPMTMLGFIRSVSHKIKTKLFGSSGNERLGTTKLFRRIGKFATGTLLQV